MRLFRSEDILSISTKRGSRFDHTHTHTRARAHAHAHIRLKQATTLQYIYLHYIHVAMCVKASGDGIYM